MNEPLLDCTRSKVVYRTYDVTSDQSNKSLTSPMYKPRVVMTRDVNNDGKRFKDWPQTHIFKQTNYWNHHHSWAMSYLNGLGYCFMGIFRAVALTGDTQGPEFKTKTLIRGSVCTEAFYILPIVENANATCKRSSSTVRPTSRFKSWSAKLIFFCSFKTG